LIGTGTGMQTFHNNPQVAQRFYKKTTWTIMAAAEQPAVGGYVKLIR
jgi:hypothetical protein